MDISLSVFLVILLILLVLCFILLILVIRNRHQTGQLLKDFKVLEESMSNVENISDNLLVVSGKIKDETTVIEEEVKMVERMSQDTVSDLGKTIGEIQSLGRQSTELRQTLSDGLNKIMESNAANLKEIRQETKDNLKEIKGVVDEQLQTTLDRKLKESFEQVVEHLSTLQNGLGEVRALSSNVSDLKKTLSSVKTRGIWGEMVLGSILEQTLSPDQYATNQITVPGSKDPVEFAIKLPGDGNTPVWLPIDSKFPGDSYNALLDAYNDGDKDEIEKKWKSLEKTLIAEGTDIKNKYLHVPDTTDFGIMFLPVEGLYAEAVKRGMVEKLQSINITLAGPTTMTALLNSLRMGFRTLAIQERSNEVWKILGAVKTEFGKYQKILESVQKKIKNAEDDLEQLVGVRTRMISRSLRTVESGNELELLSDEIKEITNMEEKL